MISFMADLTTKILEEIRDELKETRSSLKGELKEVRGELTELRTDLSGRIQQLEKRQTETEIRLATELVAVTGAVTDLKDALLEDRALRATVQNHEERLRALESAGS